MKFRIFTEPQQGADYQTLRNVAVATEELGFDAFFRSDHYLKMGDDSGLPGPTDAWTTLAGLAIETSRIRLGTLMSAAPSIIRFVMLLALTRSLPVPIVIFDVNCAAVCASADAARR